MRRRTTLITALLLVAAACKHRAESGASSSSWSRSGQESGVAIAAITHRTSNGAEVPGLQLTSDPEIHRIGVVQFRYCLSDSETSCRPKADEDPFTKTDPGAQIDFVNDVAVIDGQALPIILKWRVCVWNEHLANGPEVIGWTRDDLNEQVTILGRKATCRAWEQKTVQPNNSRGGYDAGINAELNDAWRARIDLIDECQKLQPKLLEVMQKLQEDSGLTKEAATRQVFQNAASNAKNCSLAIAAGAQAVETSGPENSKEVVLHTFDPQSPILLAQLMGVAGALMVFGGAWTLAYLPLPPDDLKPTGGTAAGSTAKKSATAATATDSSWAKFAAKNPKAAKWTKYGASGALVAGGLATVYMSWQKFQSGVQLADTQTEAQEKFVAALTKVLGDFARDTEGLRERICAPQKRGLWDSGLPCTDEEYQAMVGAQ